MPQNDLVVDANVMCLYGTRAAAGHRALFQWLKCCGGLCVSHHLLMEYARQGSPLVASLIDDLGKFGRLSKIKKSTINAFGVTDATYAYTCNPQDIPVARTCFRSFRKLLVSHDASLRSDVNGFPLVGGVQPTAFHSAPMAALVAPTGGCGAGSH